MSRVPSEHHDLSCVAAYFEGRGLRAQRFSKEEARNSKAPDFQIMSGTELFAHCEVKPPRDEWLDEQLDLADPGEIVGGARCVPIFNRLSKIIERAVKHSTLSIRIAQRLTSLRL